VSSEEQNDAKASKQDIEDKEQLKKSIDEPADNASRLTNNADAQIQAHQQQHQRHLQKIIGVVVALLLIVVVGSVAYKLLSDSDSASIDPPLIQATPELSDSELASYRAQFKLALTQYENDVQPNIDKIMLSDWEASKVTELPLLKNRALTAFAEGAFLQAKQYFDTLYTKSNTLILEWQAQTEQHIEDAKSAFENDQIPQAQLNLNKALALMPTNSEAMELQSRLDAYSEVAILLRDLQVAKIENNLPKQISLLKDIIELDPQRSELNEDLDDIKVSYNQQTLASLLSSAESALAANQLSKAQQLVNEATAIKPSSKGAQSLNNRIAQVKAQQSLRSIKASLTRTAEQDNWEEVASISSSALQNYPTDAELKEFQSQAQQVISAKKSLAIFIARPGRLADDNIREAATKAIQSAFAPSLLSPSLQQQIEQAANMIDQYKSPVDVTVVSDGKTYIVVSGVGHVGEHREKVISLTPGNYVLQGKREGYRNKRLEFTVISNTPLVLTLICDEKI